MARAAGCARRRRRKGPGGGICGTSLTGKTITDRGPRPQGWRTAFSESSHADRARYETRIVFTLGSVGVRAATSAYSYLVPGLEPGLPNPKPADSSTATASRIL